MLQLRIWKGLYQEAKQVGLLYHIFDIEGLLTTLKTNTLSSHNYNYISMTRNKLFNDYLGSRPSSYFKFEIDGDKLSEKYKIAPHSYETRAGSHFEEYEERILTNEIKNIFKYITKFIFLVDKFEYGYYSQKDVLFDEGYNIGGGKRFKIDDLQKVIFKIPKQILYIQRGNKIYRDDNYFKLLFKEVNKK